MKNYLKSKKSRWLKLSLALPLVLLIGGITYALLTSQEATLTGNSIQTVTAALSISTDGQNFGVTTPGFSFNNLIPGGVPMPLMGYSVYMKNTGNVPLTPKIAINKQPTNPNNIDLGKVKVIMFAVDTTNNEEYSFTMQDLLNGSRAFTNNIGIGMTRRYNVQISMDADAVSGNTASLSGIDLVFSGTTGS